MHKLNSHKKTSPPKQTGEHRKAFSLFFGTNPALLDAVETAAVIRKVDARSMILSQDDTSDDIYYLMKGTAYAALVTPEGDEIWLDSFKGGSLFGEMAAFGHKERTASIFSSTKVTIAKFSADAFMAIMRNYGEVGIKTTQLLTERIKHTTMRMFELSAMSAHGRVYAELLRMAQKEQSTKVMTIEKMPHKTRIAEKIHSTRETVSRAISDLQTRGIVKIDGKKMQIIAPERLEEMML